MITLHEQLAAPCPLPLVINGLSGGAIDAFAVETLRDAGRKSLALVRSDQEAARLCAVLADSGLRAAVYASRELCFFESSASHDVERERLSVLYRFLADELDVIVTTPYAALQPTMPPERLLELSAETATLSPDALVLRLLELGYVRVDAVESAGQFSRRGGIVDLFPSGEEMPLRLDYFGDEIDRATSFDPITQRTVGETTPPILLPAREVICDKEGLSRVEKTILAAEKKADEKTREALSAELEAIASGRELSFLDKYLRAVYPKAGNLFSYLPSSETLPILLLGTTELKEHLDAKQRLLEEAAAPILEGQLYPERITKYLDAEMWPNGCLDGRLAIHVNTFSGGISVPRAAGLFGFRCRRTVSYASRIELLCEELLAYRNGKYRILILTESDGEAESLSARLAEHGFASVRLPETATLTPDMLAPSEILIGLGRVSSGYELLNAKIAILTTATDETREAAHRRLRRRERRISAGQHLLSYADLSEGDYVVHATHGIGLFEGITTMTVDGVSRDYINIRYAGVDKLFLPADRLELISKYIGAKAEDGTVKLSKLGGTDWQKQKTRAKAAAKEIARDLIALYAERSRRAGFAFCEDSDLEDQFAEAFPFEETDAQAQAIHEIFGDMVRPVPMDRLLCGDVGFGKTEVALRAAFKAIVSGKQAAILVPTTILALQHYQTALSRMRGFPVTVEMLSRFRTPKEQASVLRRLRRVLHCL